jgi:transcriptional regulator with XRE-family HTH domain
VVNRITIEHDDGQVVTVQFGPERKIGPVHVSDGERVTPVKGTGGALSIGGEPIGKVKDWTFGPEAPGELVETGRSMTEDEIAAILDEPETIEIGKEYYCAFPGVKCRVRVKEKLGIGYLVERVTQPGIGFIVGRLSGMLKAYPEDRTGDLLTKEEIADLLSKPEKTHTDVIETVGGRVDVAPRLRLTPEGEAALKDIEPVSPLREKKKRRSSFEPPRRADANWNEIIPQWMAWLGTKQKRTLTYTDFAIQAGIKPGDFSKYRRNVKNFTEYQQEKFAKALGVTLEQFQKGPGSLPELDAGEKKQEPAPEKKAAKKDPNAILLAAGTTVEALCAACRNEEFGEKRTCVGCSLIKFGPTDPDTDPEYKQITSAAKAHICLHCVRKNRGQCDICVLTAAIEVENLIAAGASLTAAVDMAADNHTAAMERIAERFDERAGR